MIPEKVKGGDRVTLEGERACPSFEQIAAREKCSVRKVNMTISLAFLAPDLVKAAIEGRLPRGLGVARLCDCPAEWVASVPDTRPSKPLAASPCLLAAFRSRSIRLLHDPDGAVLLSIALQCGVPLDMIRGATTRNPPGPRRCSRKGWRP